MKNILSIIFILFTSFSYSDQAIESYIAFKISDCEYVLCHNPSLEEKNSFSSQIFAYKEVLNFIKNKDKNGKEIKEKNAFFVMDGDGMNLLYVYDLLYQIPYMIPLPNSSR